jgi:hypothetical protein
VYNPESEQCEFTLGTLGTESQPKHNRYLIPNPHATFLTLNPPGPTVAEPETSHYLKSEAQPDSYLDPNIEQVTISEPP